MARYGTIRAVRPGGARPAFSLAEVMIAIGILGIGLIMVAATFPVGLDQARIVTDQSLSPVVANEAFAGIQLLLDDPSGVPRIGAEATPTVHETTLRRSILAARNLSPGVRTRYMGGRPSTDPPQASLLPPALLVRGAFDPAIPENQQSRDLTSWLRAPASSYGPQLGYYPSLSGTLIPEPGTPTGYAQRYRWQVMSGSGSLLDPSYAWSALFRFVNTSSSSPVEFAIFVNRRSWTEPLYIGFDERLNEDTFISLDQAVVASSDSSLQPIGPEVKAGLFAPGTRLLRLVGGQREVAAVDYASRQINLKNPTTGQDATLDDRGFWFVPVDPATGKSPTIEIYTRTFEIQ